MAEYATHQPAEAPADATLALQVAALQAHIATLTARQAVHDAALAWERSQRDRMLAGLAAIYRRTEDRLRAQLDGLHKIGYRVTQAAWQRRKTVRVADMLGDDADPELLARYRDTP